MAQAQKQPYILASDLSHAGINELSDTAIRRLESFRGLPEWVFCQDGEGDAIPLRNPTPLYLGSAEHGDPVEGDTLRKWAEPERYLRRGIPRTPEEREVDRATDEWLRTERKRNLFYCRHFGPLIYKPR